MENILLNALQQKFPNLPRFVIKEMYAECKQTAKDYRELAKFSFSVIPRKLESFEDIVETANLVSGYNNRYETDSTKKMKLFADPISTKPEKLVLVQGMGTVNNSWYEIIENAHPSLLVEAMKILTREKLAEMGMPHYVKHIVLPTSPKQAFINEFNKPCFASITVDEKYNPVRRHLSFVNMSATGNVHAMLLRLRRFS